MANPITKVLRTPEERFANLEGWDWGDPEYHTSRLFGADIRMAYWDLVPESSNAKDSLETVLLTHGEPSWSYLNRRLIAAFLSAGYRVVCFDQVGFGRSDKPAKESDYSYERHVAWNEDLLWNHLDLNQVTAVLQDWGGLLGLRVAARSPHRFVRLILSNTILPTGDPVFEEDFDYSGFYGWKEMAHNGLFDQETPIQRLFEVSACGPSCGDNGELTQGELDAYAAPFPSPEYMAGARVFPELVPTKPDDSTGRPQTVGQQENRAMWQVYKSWHIPILLAFSDSDAVLGDGYKVFLKYCPGVRREMMTTIEGVSHFSQDGGGKQLAEASIKFMKAFPLPTTSKL